MSQVAKRLKQEQDDRDLMIVLEDLPLVKVIVKSTQYCGAETSSNLLCRRWKIFSWQQVRPHSLGKII